MHIAFVWNDVPNSESGAGMVSTGIVRAMLNAGHHVTICVLAEPNTIQPQHIPRLEEFFSSPNVTVVHIPIPAKASWAYTGLRRWLHRLRVIVRPRNDDVHPLVLHAETIGGRLAPLRPDVIIVFQAIEALHGVSIAPKMALLGAMEHLTHVHWWLVKRTWKRPLWSIVNGVRVLFVAFLIRRWNLQMAAEYDRVATLGAQDAVWLRRHDVTRALYLPAFVEDPGPAPSRARLVSIGTMERSGRKPKIILVGHVRTAPTLAGLYFFGRQVLPGLERALGADGFEVHVIGRYALPPDLARVFDKPSVRLRGFVADVDSEFLTADVLCVPTPIDFSTRVRICVGFAFGCCVVAHNGNAAGMPELMHEYNILMAGTAPGMVSQIIRAFGDDDLRIRLGTNARQTFEDQYSVEKAGRILLGELARMRIPATPEITGVDVTPSEPLSRRP